MWPRRVRVLFSSGRLTQALATMVYVAFIAIMFWLSSWLAVYAFGVSLRDTIRVKAPALEPVVFPYRDLWLLTSPFFSIFSVLSAGPRVSKLRPELAPQFKRFRASVYFSLVSLVAVVVAVYLCDPR